MGKFLVTLGTGTGMGAVMQCASVTAMINNMPIAVVGDIATHPYGPDTLVEGIPTILLNGKPVCFSTAKTSKGGVVLPNTTVKISSPTFNSYTGIVHSARVESHLCFEETEDEEVLAKQQKEQENEEPVKCTEIKLYSDFAWQQFINLAENDPVCMFKHRISEIFGNDILEDAVDKLRAACKDRSITNPEIEVCENRIHGLLAAYHTKTNKIYVSRQFIENSLDDNDNKHMLMAALIEEFGHHVDWLLRCKYDKNVNDDAEGDEGARFAYKSMYHIYEIDYRELQEIAFATVETNEGSYDLKWDLNELLDILDTYTRDRQYGTDDHVGEYEGFKIEDLESKGGFGHENIQREAIERSGVQALQKAAMINLLYRGNWIRDYSQLLAPWLFDILSMDKSNDSSNDVFSALLKEFIPDPLELKGYLTDVVRLLAIKKFYGRKEYQIIRREKYYEDPHFWRGIVDDEEEGLIPGFPELLGLSNYFDHCDNPKGSSQPSETSKQAGFKELDMDTLKIDKRKGLKGYLIGDTSKSGADAQGSGSEKMPTVAQNLIDLLSGVKSLTGKKDLVRLGSVLHIIQDYYGHSNFAEVYIVKLWYDKMITWCQDADACRDYSKKNIDWYDIDENMVFDTTNVHKILNVYSIQKGNRLYKKDDKLSRNDNSIKYINKKALYTPVTTGTYDFDDMLSTCLNMLEDKKFSLQLDSPKRNMEPGVLSANDLFLLLFCRQYDLIRGDNGTFKAVKILDGYFRARDVCIESKKSMKAMIPSFMKKTFEYFDENILYHIKQIQRIFQNATAHFAIGSLQKIIKDYQLALKERLENFGKDAINGIYIHGNDPSHTMLAKDEPTHPINEISGKMAILSSADILIKMDRFIKGYNYTAKEIIHDIIIHPLHTDYFDRLVIDFVNANPLKIFNSCTYSNQLEGIRVATCKSQTGIDRIINIGEEANNDYDINQFSNPYQGSEDGEEFSLKEFVEQEVQIEPLVETQKELNDELVKQLQSYAEGNKCRELDENTFVEFMKCYYYDITKEDEEELKKIWRKYAKHYFLWFIKQDKLSNSLDFSYHAYKVAVSYLDKRPKPGPFENFNQELNCNININQITE